MVKRILFIVLWCFGIAATLPGVFIFAEMILTRTPIPGLSIWHIFGIYTALELLFPILFLVYKKRAFAIVSIVLFTLVLIPCVILGGYSLYLVVTGQFHWC